jgi:hypothetical protein
VRAIRLLALALLLAGVISWPAGADGGSPGDAQAVGYAALLPGGTQGAAGASTEGPAERTASVSGLRPAGGGTLGNVQVTVETSSDGPVGEAEGSVSASGLTLLDGRVSIASLRLSGRAAAGPDQSQAGLTEASVQGVVVDGQPVAAGPGSRIEVAGIGAIVFMEQVSDGGTLRANAVRVEVTDPQAAAVIGQPFVVGHIDLTARAGMPAPARPQTPAPAAPEPTTPAGTTTAPPRTAPIEAPAPSPLPPPAPLGLPRRPAPALPVTPNAGYVFPVYGDVGFSDDYGAPRSDTGWHHGNDIFATMGTPVLAVADGTLSRVGVNTLGGNRLWLTDDAGNSFYYAHLSAYAPASVEGARVSAGQVIGFVGNTGDALTTPPHLHFEVHPGDGDSVDPYPYLLAWQRGTAIPLAFRQAAASASPAPAVGAVLVQAIPELDVAPAPGDGIATPTG